MKTLAEHNAKYGATHSEKLGPHPNGIACDLCGHELEDLDSSGAGVFFRNGLGYLHVRCPACGFVGARVF